METIRIKINAREYPARYTMQEAIGMARDIAIIKRQVAHLFAMCNTGEFIHLGTYQPHVKGYLTYTDPEKNEYQIPCCEAHPTLPKNIINI